MGEVKGKWSKKEETFLKNNYKKMLKKDIAKSLNRSINSVYAKCRQLNYISARTWSEEDTKYLIDNWEKKSNEHFAKKLKRNVQNVKVKACSLGLGLKRDWYTTDEVADILGLSNRSLIRYYIKKDMLKADKMPYENKTVYSISEEQVKRFAKTYTEKWDTRKAPIIIAMYSERMPKWLSEKIENDKDRPIKHNSVWTNEEDMILQEMYSDLNMDKKVISKKLKRSIGAIEERVRILYINRSDRGVVYARKCN